MRGINVKPNTILLEPFGRNTGPAITLAALIALQKLTDDPILLILSSDHEIKNQKKFIEAINKGIEYANHGKIVTFESSPSPHTGYGYIKSDKPFDLSEIEE